MRHITNIRLGLAEFLLLMGGALTWTSCTEDNIGYDTGYDVGNNEVEEVAVRLNISAGRSGGISVTRADVYEGSYEDADALEGEYMNTLCVFVVDANGVIVEKLTPATSDDGWEGKWPEWTSEEDLILTNGTYTVYAFSNWETVYDEENPDNNKWAAIMERTADGSTTLTDDDLNFNIDDPAGKVDIENGMYIPMSGSKTITVAKGSTSFDVGMDRLVGRVEVTIYGESGTDAADITLNSFTFGNCADKVPLMNDGTASGEDSFSGEYKIDFEETTLGAVNKDGTSSDAERNSTTLVFYVNETSNTTGFDISLATTRKGEESSYTATTTTTNIPRNYILPIYLILSTYTLSLDVSAYAGPIGAEERQYYNITQDNEDTYTVTLATVTTWFTMTPSLKDSGEQNVTGVTWTWEQTSANGQLSTDVSDNDDCMLTASGLTASNGYKYSFDLTATWTSSGVEYKRTFHINIVLYNYQPTYNQAPAHSSWQGWCWGREQLNMHRIH